MQSPAPVATLNGLGRVRASTPSQIPALGPINFSGEIILAESPAKSPGHHSCQAQEQAAPGSLPSKEDL